jgi:nitrogen regulatory protein PII
MHEAHIEGGRHMQKIEAIVRRSVTDQIRDALMQHRVEGITMTDLRAAPPAGAPPTFYRGAPYFAEVPATKIEVVVDDTAVPAVVEAIVAAAQMAGTNEGRILVIPIAAVIPIATGMPSTVRGGPGHGKRPRLCPVTDSRRVGTASADGRPARDS